MAVKHSASRSTGRHTSRSSARRIGRPPGKQSAKPTGQHNIDFESLPYKIREDFPVSEEAPDYEKLSKDRLSVHEANILTRSLQMSRNTWLAGPMFTKFWTKPARGVKSKGEKENMAKLGECLMQIGPHQFEVKLFTVRNETIEEVEQPPAAVAGQPPTRFGHGSLPTPSSSEAGSAPLLEGAKGSFKVYKPSASQNGASSTTAKGPQGAFSSSLHPAARASLLNSSASAVQKADSIPAKETENLQQAKLPAGAAKDTDSHKSDSDNKASTSEPAGGRESNSFNQDGTSSAEAPSSAAALPEEGTGNSNKDSHNSIRPPPPQPFLAEPISSASNQETIAKLRAMARIDLSLASLMRHVATGKGSNTEIALFQAYIAKARTMTMELILQSTASALFISPSTYNVNPSSYNKAYGSAPVKATPKTKPYYTGKKVIISTTVVFEFKDNPSDRFVLPRDSILEVVNHNAVLCSFLITKRKGEIKGLIPGQQQISKADKKSKQPKTPKAAAAPTVVRRTRAVVAAIEAAETKKKARAPTPEPVPPQEIEEEPDLMYIPTTIVLVNIPGKAVPIVEKAVNAKEDVVKKMEEIMTTGVRAKDWWLWYQVEPDKRLDDVWKQQVKPVYTAPVSQKRVRQPGDAPRKYKKREKKPPVDENGKPVIQIISTTGPPVGVAGKDVPTIGPATSGASKVPNDSTQSAPSNHIEPSGTAVGEPTDTAGTDLVDHSDNASLSRYATSKPIYGSASAKILGTAAAEGPRSFSKPGASFSGLNAKSRPIPTVFSESLNKSSDSTDQQPSENIGTS